MSPFLPVPPQQFSSAGAWLLTIPSSCQTSACAASLAIGQFDNPFFMTIDGSGNLWVTDESNNRVQQLTPTGTWIQTIPGGCANGSPPSCTATYTNGKFDQPWGIFFSSGR